MSLGISYKISAVDGISRVVKKISRNVRKMNKGVDDVAKTSERTQKKVSRSFRKMAKSSSALSGKLKMLAIGSAVFLGLKNVATKGMEFEDSIAGIAAITGAAGEDLKFFEKESIRMSSQFGMSAAQIAKSFTDIASAKSELLDDPQALAKIVSSTILLARAGGETVDNATSVMTKSLNMFGAGAEKAKEFSDIIIKGTVLGAAQLPSFSAAMLNAGEASAAAGLNFKETTAIIQAMSKGGAGGERIGTRLNALIRSIKKMDPKLKLSGGNIQKIITILGKEMEKGGDIANKLDEEAKAGLRTLILQQAHLKTFLKDIEVSAGETKKAAAIRMDTTSVKLAKLRARLDTAMLALFKRLQPVLSKMITQFTNWIDSLTEQDLQGFAILIDGIIMAIKGIAGFIKGIGSGLNKMGTFLGEAAGFIRNVIFGSDDSEKSSPVPDSAEPQKDDLVITLKGPSNIVDSIAYKSGSGNGSGRKAKVKNNMGNNNAVYS